MTFTDTMDGMSYRIHILIGSVIGVFTSAWTDNLDQILLTVILGFAGAIGAAIAKLLVTLLRGSKPIKKFEERNNVNEDK